MKLGTVIVLDSLSKPIDFGFKMSRSEAQGLLACILSDCSQTHNEEPLPLPIIYLRRRRRTAATLPFRVGVDLHHHIIHILVYFFTFIEIE